jgi:transcription initiation factor TFIIB
VICIRLGERNSAARTLANQAEDPGVTTGVYPAGVAAACRYEAGREQGRRPTQSEAAG